VERVLGGKVLTIEYRAECEAARQITTAVSIDTAKLRGFELAAVRRTVFLLRPVFSESFESWKANVATFWKLGKLFDGEGELATIVWRRRGGGRIV